MAQQKKARSNSKSASVAASMFSMIGLASRSSSRVGHRRQDSSGTKLDRKGSRGAALGRGFSRGASSRGSVQHIEDKVAEECDSPKSPKLVPGRGGPDRRKRKANSSPSKREPSPDSAASDEST